MVDRVFISDGQMKEGTPGDTSGASSDGVQRSVIGNQGGVTRVVFENGQGRTEQSGVMRATATEGVPPGHVRVGNTITTIEAARAAGFEVADDPSQVRVQPSTGETVENAKGGSDAPASNDAVVARMSDTLNQAARQLGNDRVNMALDQVARSGDVESVKLDGVTPQQVDNVVQGYVRQADAALAPVGASVAILTEALTADELTIARTATINNDESTLRRLGEQAVSKLSQLDHTDPQKFEEFIKAKAPGLNYQPKPGGGYLVEVDGVGLVTWQNAVRLGALKYL
jgi:hypothetical protein